METFSLGVRVKKLLSGLVLVFAVVSNANAGNGAPSGSHYGLNIIGVPKGKTADMTGNNGRRIFVPLVTNLTKAKILLSEGEFKVLDANATDGSASFQLPSPDPMNTGTTTYSVFARALGKPGGAARIATCATDPLTMEEVCSTLSTVAVRSTGKSNFDNVTSSLLYIYVDLDGDGEPERYPLFDDALKDYFWSYDNAGLKLLQLRFYPVSTTVP